MTVYKCITSKAARKSAATTAILEVNGHKIKLPLNVLAQSDANCLYMRFHFHGQTGGVILGLGADGLHHPISDGQVQSDYPEAYELFTRDNNLVVENEILKAEKVANEKVIAELRAKIAGGGK
jgi:hypothetical protein